MAPRFVRINGPGAGRLGGAPIDPMPSPGERRPRAFVAGPTLGSLPGGLSAAPFRWEYLDRAFDIELVGVTQDPETLTLRPEIGWAVREAGQPA